MARHPPDNLHQPPLLLRAAPLRALLELAQVYGLHMLRHRPQGPDTGLVGGAIHYRAPGVGARQGGVA